MPDANICWIKFYLFILKFLFFLYTKSRVQKINPFPPIASIAWCITGLIQAGGVQFTHGISLQFREKRPIFFLLCHFVSSLQAAADLFMWGTKWTFVSKLFIAAAHHIKRNCRLNNHQSLPVRLCKLTPAMDAALVEVRFGRPAGELGIAAD